MGRKTRSRARAKNKNKNQAPAVVRHFTDVEEEFFRAGAALSEAAAPAESFEDLDVGYERPSLLDRLFSRWQMTTA